MPCQTTVTFPVIWHHCHMTGTKLYCLVTKAHVSETDYTSADREVSQNTYHHNQAKLVHYSRWVSACLRPWTRPSKRCLVGSHMAADSVVSESRRWPADEPLALALMEMALELQWHHLHHIYRPILLLLLLLLLLRMLLLMATRALDLGDYAGVVLNCVTCPISVPFILIIK